MSTMSDSIFDTARQHLNKGRPVDAARICRAALAEDPTAHRHWHILALATMQLGQIADAQAAFDQARAHAPEIAEYHNSFGEFLRINGDAQGALRAYLAAMQADPGYVEAQSNAVIVLHDLGKLDDAEAAGRQALKLKPNHPEAANNLARVLLERGKIAEAETLLRKALQRRTDQPDLHVNLGGVLAATGRVADAGKSLRRALALSPGHRKAGRHLLRLLPRLGSMGDGPALLAALAARQPTGAEEMLADHVALALADPATPMAELIALQTDWSARVQPMAQVSQPGQRRQPPRLAVMLPAHAATPHWPLMRALLRDPPTGVALAILAGLPGEVAADPLPDPRCDEWRGYAAKRLIGALARDGMDILLDLTGFAEGAARLELLGTRILPLQIAGWSQPLLAAPAACDVRLVDPAAYPGPVPDSLFAAPGLWAADPVAIPEGVAGDTLAFCGPLAGIWSLLAALPRLDGLPVQRLRVMAPELADAATAEMLRSRLLKQYRLAAKQLSLCPLAPDGGTGTTARAALTVLADAATPQMVATALAESDRVLAAAGRHPAARMAAAVMAQAGLDDAVSPLDGEFAEAVAARWHGPALHPLARGAALSALDPAAAATRFVALILTLWNRTG